VLVVEDDEAMQRVLQQTLRPRYTVLTASCWNQAHEIRSRAEVDVLVLDVNNLTDRLGVDELCLEAGRTPIVLLASSHREPCGNGRARSGPLMTFPARPVSLRELHRTLEEAVVHKDDGREAERSQSAADESNGILAQSVAMRNVMALIDRAAQRDTPILLIGESGTGKELL